MAPGRCVVDGSAPRYTAVFTPPVPRTRPISCPHGVRCACPVAAALPRPFQRPSSPLWTAHAVRFVALLPRLSAPCYSSPLRSVLLLAVALFRAHDAAAQRSTTLARSNALFSSVALILFCRPPASPLARALFRAHDAAAQRSAILRLRRLDTPSSPTDDLAGLRLSYFRSTHDCHTRAMLGPSPSRHTLTHTCEVHVCVHAWPNGVRPGLVPRARPASHRPPIANGSCETALSRAPGPEEKAPWTARTVQLRRGSSGSQGTGASSATEWEAVDFAGPQADEPVSHGSQRQSLWIIPYCSCKLKPQRDPRAARASPALAGRERTAAAAARATTTTSNIISNIIISNGTGWTSSRWSCHGLQLQPLCAVPAAAVSEHVVTHPART